MMSRSEEHIDAVIDVLRDIWKKYPDFRLCQLLHNIIWFMESDRKSPHVDIYYVEDDKLVKFLKRFSYGSKNSG